MIPERVRAILRDPVTLEPIKPATDLGYLELRSGGLTVKNDQELDHFKRTFKPLPPADKLYATKIKAVPAPMTSEETIVLDIGCGPYDCLSAMPGTHIFLDDLMNLYVSELDAQLDGTRVCARTELMPFADASIDIVYSINMIDHVDDMPETMKELHRILADDGAVHMQTYWNSHPLLPTEPGVFDRHFVDEHVSPLFEIEYGQTYAVGDLAISSGYTMDIAGFILRKRADCDVTSKPRDRYEDPTYLGPQSHISSALATMADGNHAAAARHIASLEDEANYRMQFDLLTARLNIHQGDSGTANEILKAARAEPRIRRNPYARIAVAEVEAFRLQRAAKESTERAAALARALKNANVELPAELAGPDWKMRARKRASSLRRAAYAFRRELTKP